MGGRSGIKSGHGYNTRYSGMEAITESYEDFVNGVKIIRTRTRYRKRRRKKK